MSGLMSLRFSLPGRYAQALIQASQNDYRNDFHQLLAALNADAHCRFLLKAQYLKRKKVLEFADLMAEVLSLQPLFTQFLKVVIDHNRLCILEDIARCYRLLWNQLNNIKDINILTAMPIQPHEQEMINPILKSMFKETLNVTHHTDPQLLGGVVIESSEMRIDASIQHHLSKLKKSLSL
ncbi:MAG: ATP synthase F1 subunit delta [Alphaproteobacteria bacterium]|nr:ATP synthase F1 subunit delta [Alphaproteobacteria bacterium]